MITNEECGAVFVRVMDSMVKRGWLISYTLTDGKGYRLNWTLKGAERAMLLKKIIVGFGLERQDNGPMVFDKIARGERLDVKVRVGIKDAPPELWAFWKECIDDLGLHGDVDGLLGFAHIITGWAPGEGS